MGASSPLSFGYVQVNLFGSGARVLGEKGSFSQHLITQCVAFTELQPPRGATCLFDPTRPPTCAPRRAARIAPELVPVLST